jgi:hypothetical protein
MGINKLLKMIYLILIALLFSGCGYKDVYYNIPENERPIYQNGDELIYKSNTVLPHCVIK